ncbi:MAG: hypothetical protein HON43_02880 [Alphaproteobacteria bacterium]|nr:hypothetical protein [Alphaproteobacteria bacterium]
MYAFPTMNPINDTAILESEAFRLTTQLQSKLSTMGFGSLESGAEQVLKSGVERVKAIRQARAELLELQAEPNIWEALYAQLQPLKMPGTEDRLVWPNQTFEMACKGNLLARAVFRNDTLFADLEHIVANRFSDKEYVEQVLFNLFWWNPVLLERMHLETLLVAGSINMKMDNVDSTLSAAVYGNSLAMWTFLKGMMNDEDADRSLFMLLCKKRGCVLGNLSTHMPESGVAATLSRPFAFLEQSDYRKAQKKLWRQKSEQDLRISLENGDGHAGEFLGEKLAPQNKGAARWKKEEFLGAIASFVKAAKTGETNGWHLAYYYYNATFDRKVINSGEEDFEWRNFYWRMTFLVKGKTTRIEKGTEEQSIFTRDNIGLLVKEKIR